MSSRLLFGLEGWLRRQPGAVPPSARRIEIASVVDSPTHAMISFDVWPDRGRPVRSGLVFPIDADLRAILNNESPAQPEG